MMLPAAETSWRLDPRLSLEWRLERVKTYLSRLPLANVRGVVFGSVARRAFGIGSDTDLLVISDELPARVRDRIDLLGNHRDGLGEIDPLGWTEQEWWRRRNTDPFGSLLAREGIDVSSR
jgi:predicted nucleotidyltransferase